MQWPSYKLRERASENQEGTKTHVPRKFPLGERTVRARGLFVILGGGEIEGGEGEFHLIFGPARGE